MKILELRFKNLNSLYGEWKIDFTAPEYSSNGIFALTGPTGAGKSTVLDAICLALYGATPRLGRITKSSNELMSQKTGECSSEVLFVSKLGKFRCRWEQRKARKSPEGKLQDQEHQIVDAVSGKVIEAKKSRVLTVIEEKTGMDFDRFTRSILLAQGSFDTFLKADSEKKSKVLEQITGTEIYTKISQMVHEKNREENDKLKILERDLSFFEVLEPNEVDDISNKISTETKKIKLLKGNLKEIEIAIQWHENIRLLKSELDKRLEEKRIIEVEKKGFSAKKKIMDIDLQ